MQFFDATHFEVEPQLAKRLGFKKIFSKSEIDVRESPGGSKKYLLKSSNTNNIYKAAKDPNCLGIVITDSTIIRKSLEQMNQNEKPLVFFTSDFTSDPNPLRVIGRARHLLNNARRSKVDIALVSMAQDSTQLLSASQIVEIGVLLGLEDQKAKEALSIIGDIYDN